MCVGNMNSNNRWESSSRPLFVKTIWDGNNHHVILNKGDPLGEIVNFPKTSRSRKSSGSDRSTASAPVRMNDDNLQVSKLQFVVTGGKELKKTPSQLKQIRPNKDKTVTISVIPKTHVKFKSLTEELVLKHKKLPTRKSNSLDIAERSPPIPTTDNGVLTPYFTYTKTTEKNNSNSLSERVLNWMNLTNTEIIDYNENYFKHEIKKRAVTAHTCSNLQAKPEIYVADRRYKLNSAPKSDISKISEEDSNEVTSIEEIVENPKFNLCRENVTIPKMISQHENASSKSRYDFSKRQLHIFMPNIPKRSFSDGGSTLSGKSSSFLRFGK